MSCPPLYSQDALGARQRRKDLTARRLNATAKIIESHKNKTQAHHYGSKHTYIHTHGLQDHPGELTWPCPLPLSAGVCPEQTGPLRREQWRPEAVLLSRRRGGGRLPVVSPCRSFWERCHTRTHPGPHTSQLLGAGAGRKRSRKSSAPTTEQLDSLSWMSSFWPPSKQGGEPGP